MRAANIAIRVFKLDNLATYIPTGVLPMSSESTVVFALTYQTFEVSTL